MQKTTDKYVTIDQAKRFNAAIQKLIQLLEGAVVKVEAAGEKQFKCSNYRQAAKGMGDIAKYARDFAGASETAPLENEIDVIIADAPPSARAKRKIEKVDVNYVEPKKTAKRSAKQKK